MLSWLAERRGSDVAFLHRGGAVSWTEVLAPPPFPSGSFVAVSTGDERRAAVAILQALGAGCAVLPLDGRTSIGPLKFLTTNDAPEGTDPRQV